MTAGCSIVDREDQTEVDDEPEACQAWMALGGATIRPNHTGLLVLLVVFVVFVFYVHSGNNWWRTDSQVSLKELLSVSIDLAASGGNRVRKIQERALKDAKESAGDNNNNKQKALHAQSKGETKEGAKQLVTDGDINSHRSIIYGFNKAFPGLHLISEEHDIKPPDFNAIPMPIKNLAQVNDISDEKVAMSDVTVWIDPLDATQEYSYMKSDQNTYVTVMICVAVHGRPVIGVIHQPFLPPPSKDAAPRWGPTTKSEAAAPNRDDDAAPNRDDDATSAAAAEAAGSSEGETPSFGRTYWAWVGRSANFEVASSSSSSSGASGAAAAALFPRGTPPKSSSDSRRRTPEKPAAAAPRGVLSSSAGAPDLPRVIISQSHPGDAAAVIDAAFGNVTLIKAGGAGYKTLALIQKKADLYYHHTRIKKWDICAGDALISAVGGRMTTLSGDSVDYSYGLTKAKHIVDGKLVVALKNKHEDFRRKLAQGLKDKNRLDAKKGVKAAKGA